MKIGIFDSGVGGLGVLNEIKKKIDFADIIYYGDSSHSPYTNKTDDEIKNYCLKIGEFLIDNRVDIIVIACEPATRAALISLKERFTSVPIIGFSNKAEVANQTFIELKKAMLKKGLKKNKKLGKVEYFITGDIERFKELGEEIIGEKIEDIYQTIGSD
nr:hypothetical protein [uncultured Cetobacterium sp.]